MFYNARIGKLKNVRCVQIVLCLVLLFSLGCKGKQDLPLDEDNLVEVGISEMTMLETLSLEEGRYKKLDLKIEPKGDYEVVWQSSNESVAVVADGLVVGISAGQTDITATVQEKSVVCHVTVTSKESMIPSEDSGERLVLELEKTLALQTGESYQFSLVVKPEGEYDVIWLSSDKKIVSVSENGIVTANRTGDAKILAIVENYVAICEVIVDTNDAETLVIDLDAYEDADAVKRVIFEADRQGVTHYILKGEYSKLGYDLGRSDSNPFLFTNVEIIDFTDVVNWPWIEYYDHEIFSMRKVPGIPTKFFSESGSCYPNLCKVIFSDEILGVDQEAFQSCSLSEIVIPQLMIVKNKAFFNCGKLTFVDLSKVLQIEENAFGGCQSLASVNLSQIKFLDSYAFNGCGLTSVKLSENVTEIKPWTFQGCVSLKFINLSNIERVEEYAFQNCSSLITLDMPLLYFAGEYAFMNCKSLENVNFPNLYTVGNDVFRGCKSLKNVDFPKLNGISDGCFISCSSLESVKCPSATSVGEYAFGDCPSLPIVDLPEVRVVGNSAFRGVMGDKNVLTTVTSFNLPKVATVGDFAFNGLALTSLNLPHVGTIGESAFEGCHLLTSVSFPSLSRVEKRALYGCGLLSSVDFPLLEYIGDQAFGSCSSLKSVDFPNVTKLGEKVFMYCKNMKSIILPKAWLLGESCFNNCPSLITLKLTCPGNINYKSMGYGSPFYQFEGSEQCVLYLNSDKKENGNGAPSVSNGNIWYDMSWKKIIFE